MEFFLVFNYVFCVSNRHSVSLSAVGEAADTPVSGKGVVDRLLGSVEINGQTYNFIDFDGTSIIYFLCFFTCVILGDGEMDKKEAEAQGMPADVFAKIDADKNGTITKKEFRDFVFMQMRMKQMQAKAQVNHSIACKLQ